ncbi:MAG TPA: GC-type dockerin domain-anchored protein [Phycisphaerales bacterium]|nr:GC-type dockerin domain-anchored protein [Phycisphaerales bacterium]HMP38508.1 GC-type dockerin domain-anchored protein [Phycisphaerales bacterium]
MTRSTAALLGSLIAPALRTSGFAVALALLASAPAAAQYPCDVNGDDVIDAADLSALEPQTKTFLVTGFGTGLPCTWKIHAECLGAPFAIVAAGTVSSGTPSMPTTPAAFAAAFAASINAASPTPVVLDAGTLAGLPLLQIAVGRAAPTDQWYLELSDGTILGTCNVFSGATCQCNPTIQLIEIANPCNADCVADVDGDGTVDARDLGLILAAWGTAEPCADLDGDGTVDGSDLGIVMAAWGPCTP